MICYRCGKESIGPLFHDLCANCYEYSQRVLFEKELCMVLDLSYDAGEYKATATQKAWEHWIMASKEIDKHERKG